MNKITGQTSRYSIAILCLVAGLLLTSLLGFHKSYFRFFPGFQDVNWAVHFHVLTIACWFALLITQAMLAKNGHFKRHRSIGKLSYLLVPIILIGFVWVTNFGQVRHKEPGLLGATFFDASMFLLFYLLAIVNRKSRESHAQYMMLSAVPFINPGLGRFIDPGVSLIVELLIFLTLFLTAYFRKRPFRPYLTAVGSYFLLLGIVVYISFIKPEIIESVWNLIWG